MFFTSEEKQAIVKVSNLMIIADGEVDTKEVLLGVIVFKKLNISETEVANAERLESTDALSIISRMTAEEKRLVGAFLGCIMAVDGDIDKTEHALWCLITSFCNLPSMTLGEAKEEIGKLL